MAQNKGKISDRCHVCVSNISEDAKISNIEKAQISPENYETDFNVTKIHSEVCRIFVKSYLTNICLYQQAKCNKMGKNSITAKLLIHFKIYSISDAFRKE